MSRGTNTVGEVGKTRLFLCGVLRCQSARQIGATAVTASGLTSGPAYYVMTQDVASENPRKEAFELSSPYLSDDLFPFPASFPSQIMILFLFIMYV